MFFYADYPGQENLEMETVTGSGSRELSLLTVVHDVDHNLAGLPGLRVDDDLGNVLECIRIVAVGAENSKIVKRIQRIQGCQG